MYKYTRLHLLLYPLNRLNAVNRNDAKTPKKYDMHRIGVDQACIST